MIQASVLFAKQILSLQGFRAGQLPRGTITALLTAFSELLGKDVVILTPLVELVKQSSQGVLVVDDTSNPKYGLKRWTKNMRCMGTNNFERGYKIVLFLWECPLGRIPVGFALWHRESSSLTELALEGFSLLRNQYSLRPEAVLADGAFAVDRILKRLSDYNWPLVMRCKRDRRFHGVRMDRLIPRGYGQVSGKLKNHTKVKVFRRKDRFFVCNRMLWEMGHAVSLYKRRWCIEEVFRAAKSTLSLNGCQQHSMRAQALYLFIAFQLFACMEIVSGHSLYKTAQNIISGATPLETILDKRIFKPC